MLRSALLPVLGVACLLACTSAAEPRVVPTVEVEEPRVDALPTAEVVPPRAEIPAPAAVVEAPMEAWSIVKLDRERSGFPWVRAIHGLKGHLELPRSSLSEPMSMAPVVVISPEGVYFAGRRVATIEYGVILDLDTKEGPLIAALKDPLHRALVAHAAEEGRLSGPRLLTAVALFADAGTPFGILVNVIYTGGQAGATSYLIAVHRPGEPLKQGSDVLQISPPTDRGQTDSELAASERRRKLEMVMEVSPTDVRIGRHVPHDPARSAWLERVSLEGDRDAAMRRITELARAMIAEEQWDMFDMPTVRFSADAYVPLETLIAALAAAGGPECNLLELGAEARSRCLFSHREVYGGSAAPPALAGR